MPEKFQNKTNGVTQRRWLAFCNPRSSLISGHRHRRVGEGAGSPAGLAARGRPGVPGEVGGDQGGKQNEARLIKQKTGVEVLTTLFDIQVKRIHEYKRQLLNVFGIIHRYNALEMTRERSSGCSPCIVVASGARTDMAAIIKLVSAVEACMAQTSTIYSGGVHPGLQREQRGGYHPRQGTSHAGTEARHLQHEIRDEQLPDHRRHGRCERRDRRGDRGENMFA